MKRIIFYITLASFITIISVLVSGCGEARPAATTHYRDTNTFQELERYGQWITVPGYGEVWRPDADNLWHPYNAGYWEYTDRGWVWFSDEPYGWIVYHYGNWAYTDASGWVWIPGYDWYPSRVRWITQDDYIGWAPLPPNGYNLPDAYSDYGNKVWIVVPAGDFDNHDINRHRVEINSIRNRRNWNFSPTLDPGLIRNATGRTVTPVSIQTENVRSGSRDLTRIKVVDRGGMERNNSQSSTNNNFTPPPVGRTTPQQNSSDNSRANRDDRNNNSTVKVRGDIVPPNQNTNTPAVKSARTENDRVVESRSERNNDAVKIKSPAADNHKKPIVTVDKKKPKPVDRQRNSKEEKKKEHKDKVSDDIQK